MYKKTPIVLVFLLGYIILRYIMSYFTKQTRIDGFREQPIHRLGSRGVNISSTVYDINLASKYRDPYCYNNPNLCNKSL